MEKPDCPPPQRLFLWNLIISLSSPHHLPKSFSLSRRDRRLEKLPRRTKKEIRTMLLVLKRRYLPTPRLNQKTQNSPLQNLFEGGSLWRKPRNPNQTLIPNHQLQLQYRNSPSL
jgi:hypothetical protein